MGGMFNLAGGAAPGLGMTPLGQSPSVSAFSSPGLDPVTMALLAKMQSGMAGANSGVPAKLPSPAGTALGGGMAPGSLLQGGGGMQGNGMPGSVQTPFPQFPGAPQVPTPPANAAGGNPIIPPAGLATVGGMPGGQNLLQMLMQQQQGAPGLGSLGSLLGGAGGTGGGFNGLAGLLKGLFGG